MKAVISVIPIAIALLTQSGAPIGLYFFRKSGFSIGFFSI